MDLKEKSVEVRGCNVDGELPPLPDYEKE